MRRFEMLYISLGLIDDYSGTDHVDAIRWTELFLAFKDQGIPLRPLDLWKISNPDEISAVLADHRNIFIHHESALATLVKLTGENRIIECLSNKNVYLQVDGADWGWLGIEYDRLSKLFTVIGVANESDSMGLNLPFIPLAISDKRDIYNSTSNRIVYIGRYKSWFNDRLHKIMSSLPRDYRIDIYTYSADAECLPVDLVGMSNLCVHGPIPFAEIADRVGNASWGLSFFNGHLPNGKIWEYISLGLPVIFERNVAEARILHETNAGLEIDPQYLSNLSGRIAKYTRSPTHKPHPDFC